MTYNGTSKFIVIDYFSEKSIIMTTLSGYGLLTEIVTKEANTIVQPHSSMLDLITAQALPFRKLTLC